MARAYTQQDDAALMRAHAGGDPDAFAELVRRHRDRLWAVALRTLGDREEAADAVQDALVSAYRSADRFRGDSAVTTWLHRIVVNACLDRARRRQARPTVPLNEVSTMVSHASPDSSADSDTALTVRAALAQLPPEQRVALVLLDMQGYSVSEISVMLGVAEGTVKSRCARGRARLAVLLGHLRIGDHTSHHTSHHSVDAGTQRAKLASEPSARGNRPRPPAVGSSGPDPAGADQAGQGGVL